VKRALLYFSHSLKDFESGVSKKCLGIIDAFRQKYTVDVFNESNGLVYFNDELIKDSSQTKNKVRLYYYNDYLLGQFHSIKNKIQVNKYDVAYIRFPGFISVGLVTFLNRLKKHNPGIIIYIEIPTYPFRKEVKGRLLTVRYYVTRLLIPVFTKYVDRIVTYSDDKKIWNIPTINLRNGYYNPALQNLKFSESNTIIKSGDDKFNIAMIALFSDWHAPDLLIESLIQYYKNNSNSRNVIIHFIGSGPNLSDCKKQAEKANISDKVIFHGKKNISEIVEILEPVQVCVGTLGYHRKKLQLGSCLKNREYAFLGKPMVLKTNDLDFPKSLYFIKYFPNDDSLLDIGDIILFYQQLKVNHPDYKNEIIKYANENLTWRKKMEPVFESYEKEDSFTKNEKAG
jgi:glycosyltransferase involved in cell wall biosynthesis